MFETTLFGVQQVDHLAHGRIHRAAHGVAQPDPVPEIGRLAPHDQHATGITAERVQQREHRIRLHAVAVERRPGGADAVAVAEFEHRDRARFLAARRRVDQDRRVVAAQQVECQVHAADSVVGDLGPRRQFDVGQPPGDLDPEPVVAEENVADAGDQHSCSHGPPSPGSISSRKK